MVEEAQNDGNVAGGSMPGIPLDGSTVGSDDDAGEGNHSFKACEERLYRKGCASRKIWADWVVLTKLNVLRRSEQNRSDSHCGDVDVTWSKTSSGTCNKALNWGCA